MKKNVLELVRKNNFELFRNSCLFATSCIFSNTNLKIKSTKMTE
jgi:hypothetical protein